jgi:hypothetical protein
MVVMVEILKCLNKLDVTPAKAGVHPEGDQRSPSVETSQDGFRPAPE